MGGLAVLFLLGLYFVLAVLVIVKVKRIWAKGLVLLAALLIPTADAVYGRYKLKQMCAAEAGLKVYRLAKGVEGFMGYPDEEYLTSKYGFKKYGFKYVEQCDYPVLGHCYRLYYKEDYLIREQDIVPKSEYRFRYIHDYQMPNYEKHEFINRSQEVVENIATGEILATYTHLTFGGGWAERFLAMFSDAGPGNVAWCSTEPFLNKPYVDTNKLLITSSLKP